MPFNNRIIGLLSELSEEFNPPLSSVVDISSYTLKIVNNAKIISFHERGELIAFIAFYCNDMNDKIGYMSMLAVAKEMRGKGLAINLITSSIDVLKNEGFKIYRLEVYKSNIKAITLYERFGFAIISELIFSYVMELEFN
jgi:ribosomal-protein-alanine N-acetyltransferase